MHFYNLHQREKGGGKFNLSLGKNAIDILTIQLFVKQLETQVLETKKKISQTQDCDWAIKKFLKRFAFKRFSAFYLKAWPSSTSLDENLITHIAHLRKDISIWKAVAKKLHSTRFRFSERWNCQCWSKKCQVKFTSVSNTTVINLPDN